MPNDMPLEELTQRYVEDRVDMKPVSIEQIERAVNVYGTLLGRPARISDLTKPSIIRFMRWIVDEGGAPVTANRKRTYLKSLWFLANDIGLMEPPPKLRAMKVPDRIPTSWIPEEIAIILRACDESEPLPCGWGPTHWRALVMTLYDSCCRVGAVLKCPAEPLLPRYDEDAERGRSGRSTTT